jgi:hypothetical protein
MIGVATRDALATARSIADRFVAWQGPSGRPDPTRCPFVTSETQFVAMNSHPTTAMARVLYLVYERTGEPAYKSAADNYAMFSFVFPRDPVEPFDDPRRTAWLRRTSERPLVNNSASYQYGNALAAYADFCRHNPTENGFSARADALFEWLQRRRTDRGQAYELGYRPSHPAVPDWAFSDDLRLVGTGLVDFARLTGRTDVLNAALRLGDYFLRPHVAGAADGVFSESLGTWCISPWPVTVRVEHFTDVQLDQAGWGFSARGGVEFLTRLHALLGTDHPRAAQMRDRCTRSVRWQFGCQFDDGALGMHARDDRWLGMTAAGLLAYADVRAAGWVDADFEAEIGPQARLAQAWLLDNATDEFIDQGGYRMVSGRSRPVPAENSLWLLAWTAEALVRIDAASSGALSFQTRETGQ